MFNTLARFSLNLLNLVFKGWVLTLLWVWFVIPISPGLIQPLNLFAAIGLSLTATYFTYPISIYLNEAVRGTLPKLTEAQKWHKSRAMTLFHMLVLFSAWVYHVL